MFRVYNSLATLFRNFLQFQLPRNWIEWVNREKIQGNIPCHEHFQQIGSFYEVINHRPPWSNLSSKKMIEYDGYIFPCLLGFKKTVEQIVYRTSKSNLGNKLRIGISKSVEKNSEVKAMMLSWFGSCSPSPAKVSLIAMKFFESSSVIFKCGFQSRKIIQSKYFFSCFRISCVFF